MNGRLRASRTVYLRKDITDVILNRLLGEHEPLADIAVRKTLRDQAYDLNLTRR